MTQDFFTIWLPFIYLYGVGSIFFVLGMIIIKKSGAVNLQIRSERRWYKVLVFGLAYFIFIHFILTFAALYW